MQPLPEPCNSVFYIIFVICNNGFAAGCAARHHRTYSGPSRTGHRLCNATRADPKRTANMKLRKISVIIIVLVVLDQLLKIWVKTNMRLDESIIVIPDWFQLHFVENNGAAFGMQIASSGAVDWGKLLLTLFRIAMIGLLGYYIHHLVRRSAAAPKGVIVGLAMILAGAIGNLMDSAFYGVIFSQSTPLTAAHFGDGYGSLLMGKVVDMFYFPLFQWNGIPSWLSFLVDGNNYFFGAVFNLADAYISVAVVYLLLFHHKFFQD